ncbi:Type I phosphodiesterase/nucleotide pyrophosphatase/phosphate transferase [Trinorchestia longiramus]|nr:Type I phosphodiesterase/nucleotide pyrophosphatase/phosphate transferase [Trinorchestia longiramus]
MGVFMGGELSALQLVSMAGFEPAVFLHEAETRYRTRAADHSTTVAVAILAIVTLPFVFMQRSAVKLEDLKLAVGCVILLIIIICVSVQTDEEPRSCPADYVDQPPLILVSMDGFRASYRERDLTPVINRLADEGVSAPFMNPSYPTITFPNHYSIVTGLYPESHGIIANSFHDPELGNFSLSNGETSNGDWWGGEPIWLTVTGQGLKSATYFWPGSDADIHGKTPTYWYPYNSSIPFENRVDQVLEWVTLPAEERPSMITLYFEEPDHTGHEQGPDSEGVNEQLVRMDGVIDRLVTGLEDAQLLDCVNLILLADHGMASGGEGWNINLPDYISDINELADTYTGAFTRINPINKSEEVKIDMMEKLACNRTDLRVYEKEGLPKRFHFSNNVRIEDIVLDLDAGRFTTVYDDYYSDGNHGYDNYFSSMNALFVARGPGFKSGIVVGSFQNIQLYNTMCHLIGVQPAPNNGTMGSLNAILTNPSPAVELPQVERPSVAAYPDDEELPGRLNVSGCLGDLQAAEDWLYVLDYTLEEQSELESKHVPWGLPQLQNQTLELTLLHQPDHVTAYSASLKMPLWTSFTLSGAPEGTRESNWTSDVRLDSDSTVTCANFNSLNNAVMAPLFYPGFSSNSSLGMLPYMVSNAVPSTEQQQLHWQDLMSHLVTRWLGGGSLNLVVGPVFDLDADSIADVFNSSRNHPERPSHLYAVVTRCVSGGSIAACEPQQLDTRAFLYPVEQVVENCLESSEYAREFSCTIKDVQISSGLNFFPELAFDDRVRLETTVHQSLW